MPLAKAAQLLPVQPLNSLAKTEKHHIDNCTKALMRLCRWQPPGQTPPHNAAVASVRRRWLLRRLKRHQLRVGFVSQPLQCEIRPMTLH